MHLFFITRGINQNVEMWKAHQQFMPLRWDLEDAKTNKKRQVIVQGALRPIQLWEYVFPEPCLNEVLTKMDIKEPYWGKGWAKSNLGQAGLRKILGCKPLPKWDKIPNIQPIFRQGVGIEVIGIKEDLKDWVTPWGTKQEAL